MTKAQLVSEISAKTGVEKFIVLQIVETMMIIVKNNVSSGESVYLRGFGSFFPKRRAEKIGRIISRNIAITIPEHYIPGFKPAKSFASRVKSGVKVKTAEHSKA
ncbi:MAG TPA: HU family DNA-binding protein [Bacteroidia bacterium]|nr:HU family DNA-binding protein [Bacteroidia bacterium]